MKAERCYLKFPAGKVWLSFFIAGAAAVSYAGELLRYDFNGGSRSPSFVATSVSGSTATWTNIAGGFSSANQDAYANTANTPGTYDRKKYLTVSVTADDGYLLNLDSFSFCLGGVKGSSGAEVSVSAVVRTDADLYATTLELAPGSVMTATHSFSVSGPTYTTYTADLTGSLYQRRKSLTFRLYGYDSITNSGVYLRFDSLSVSGKVVSSELQLVESDVCVYGGTAGGVAAAVQATRMGKHVSLLNFGTHLGGMSSGGLGMTDQGVRYTIGGISREFYQRVGAKYGVDEDYSFEPHIAEEVFVEMAADAGVNVFHGQRLASVALDGTRIKEITMDNGQIYRARMFIDASYEGDLMAKAGVSYTVGRESNDTYGETVNGVLVGSGPGGAVIDPYMIPGDPSSGLIPMVQSHTPAARGSADDLVQAYNFRMCLTQATNRIPIVPPADYDPANYELLARFIAARTPPLDILDFMTLSDISNAGTNSIDIKTDTNNRGGAISTDLPAASWNYPEAGDVQRMEIWHEHEDYIRGFFYFLATDSRVPENVRNEMQTWGLAADEFTDNGGWPNQLYVREARRMVSDYVMTEHNSKGVRVPEDSICMASYANDSHTVARVAVGGKVCVDGGLYVDTGGPYPVSYRSIIPKTGECENLLVTFALSASHVAFGSIRMEPVFMMTSQSAATAACLAMDDGIGVQQLDYEKLSAQLIADGQVLSLSGSAADVVDNSDAGSIKMTGAWTTSTADTDYGVNYFHDQNALKGTKSICFIPNIPSNGLYDVSMWWVSYSNRSTNTPVDIVHGGVTNTVTVNQKLNGGQWVFLGTYNFESGTNGSVLVRTDGTDGYVIADAVRFLPEGTTGISVELWASDSESAEPLAFGAPADSGTLTVLRSGGVASASLDVQLNISGTASNGQDYSFLSSLVTIPAGTNSVTTKIIPIYDSHAEGEETILVSLVPGSLYDTGGLQNAQIVIKDRPYHSWKNRSFDAGQLADDGVSGDQADPDHDGMVNLVEAFFGTDPLTADTKASQLRFLNRNGKDYFAFDFVREKFSDIGFSSEVTDNLLSTWQSGSGYIEELLIDDDGQMQTIRVRDLTPVDEVTNRFLRVRVSNQL